MSEDFKLSDEHGPCSFCYCRRDAAKIPYAFTVCTCPCHWVGATDEKEHLEAVRHYFPEDTKQERRKMIDSLTIKLVGLGVTPPKLGYTDLDEVCWHIDIALKDARKGKKA